jgi:hypothetical protein
MRQASTKEGFRIVREVTPFPLIGGMISSRHLRSVLDLVGNATLAFNLVDDCDPSLIRRSLPRILSFSS